MVKSRSLFLQLPDDGYKMTRFDLVGRSIGFSYGDAGRKINLPLIRRCCGGTSGGCAVSGGTLAEVMREAQPYHVMHRGSTFAVVLSSEIVDSPHLPSILQVYASL